MKKLPVLVSALLVVVVAVNLTESSAQEKKVLWLDIKDFISSATAEDVAAVVEQASSKNYSAVILALDTPGGSVDATFKIMESIEDSDLPVIGYVYPPGRHALSAGTIILVSTDFAAMAPFTTIGSSQPVLGTQPINETKFINAIVEKTVTIAELHGRNTTQVARFITHNDNLNHEKALERNVIETVAESPEDLLAKAHGAKIMKIKGEQILDTKDAVIVNHEPSIRVTILKILADPVLSTVLLAIGFLAIIYGISSPGFGGEITGAILIILGLVGQGFNPNWAAFALMAVGVTLIIYELYSPGFGAFGIGGIIILGVGTGLMITQPPQPFLVPSGQLGDMTLITSAIISPFAGFFAFITYKVVKAKRMKKVEFVLPSKEGKTLDEISSDKEGFVLVGGEYWKARSSSIIKRGTKVRVLKAEGSLLIIEPVEEETSN